MADLKSVDPRRRTITITGALGAHNISGLLADNMMSVARGSDSYTIERGVNGEVNRHRNPASNELTITINLLASSPSIGVLSNYKNLDKVNDRGVFSIYFKDHNSNSEISSLNAYILNDTPGFSDGSAAHEWVIQLVDATTNYNNIA